MRPLSELAGIGGIDGITSGPGRRRRNQSEPFGLVQATAIEGFQFEALTDILGVGGTAVVARVRSEADDSLYALKLFHPRYPRQLYEREVIIHSNMTSPHFIGFRDALSVPVELGSDVVTVPAIKLELATGSMGRGWRRRSPATPQEAIAVADQVTQGLEELHRKGLVHGDVKLENVFTTNNGIKLGDLGSADVPQSLYRPNGLPVTPATGAPEQWEGRTFPETDTYALTILLFKLLTNNEFYVDDLQGMSALGDPESYQLLVEHRVGQVPPKLAEVFESGWALYPEQRPRPGELIKQAQRLLQKPS